MKPSFFKLLGKRNELMKVHLDVMVVCIIIGGSCSMIRYIYKCIHCTSNLLIFKCSYFYSIIILHIN